MGLGVCVYYCVCVCLCLYLCLHVCVSLCLLYVLGCNFIIFQEFSAWISNRGMEKRIQSLVNSLLSNISVFSPFFSPSLSPLATHAENIFQPQYFPDMECQDFSSTNIQWGQKKDTLNCWLLCKNNFIFPLLILPPTPLDVRAEILLDPQYIIKYVKSICQKMLCALAQSGTRGEV